MALAVTKDLRENGGYLNAGSPDRLAAQPSKRPLQKDETFSGRWTGKMNYFPSPANVDISLEVRESKCEGTLTIRIPEHRQSFETPINGCATDQNQIAFSVEILGVPSLGDRFTGWLNHGSLAGVVEREGRELTNSMTGSWHFSRKDE